MRRVPVQNEIRVLYSVQCTTQREPKGTRATLHWSLHLHTLSLAHVISNGVRVTLPEVIRVQSKQQTSRAYRFAGPVKFHANTNYSYETNAIVSFRIRCISSASGGIQVRHSKENIVSNTVSTSSADRLVLNLRWGASQRAAPSYHSTSVPVVA